MRALLALSCLLIVGCGESRDSCIKRATLEAQHPDPNKKMGWDLLACEGIDAYSTRAQDCRDAYVRLECPD